MKILSLFDGISCGRVAFERAGIPVTQYFSSELDKNTIAIAQKNYPSTVQLGDVVKVREMVEAGLFGHIDYLIGGSPCQGFSFSGKQLAFDDPRSALFWEFVRILYALQKINPRIKFLLENVQMKEIHRDVITKYLGVKPVKINSALVSAQNRPRYYWCNWLVNQPNDRNITLKDIIDQNCNYADYICDKGQLKRRVVLTDIAKGFSKIDPIKAGCLTARQYANWKGNFIIVKEATKKGYVEIYENEGVDLTFPTSATRRGRRMEDKCNTLMATPTDYNWFNGQIIRKLTPIECERLQTLPDNYTAGISDAHRYKALGNGWTVDVIAHILRGSL